MKRNKTVWTDWAREQRHYRRRCTEILYHGHTTGEKHRANTSTYLDLIEAVEKFASDNLELKRMNDNLGEMLKQYGQTHFMVGERLDSLLGYKPTDAEIVEIVRQILDKYADMLKREWEILSD